jgi:hypothetical protein
VAKPLRVVTPKAKPEEDKRSRGPAEALCETKVCGGEKKVLVVRFVWHLQSAFF